MLKKIYSRLFYKWQHPRYRIYCINFENRIPVFHVTDKKCNDTFLVLTAMDIINRGEMIRNFSVPDIHRICYCLYQQYALLEKQQLLSLKEKLANNPDMD